MTPPAAHPLAVVNPLADPHATIDEDLELCDELGGAKYGLTLPKYRAWTGNAARLTGRVAYVHHGRLFTLDDESGWPNQRAALIRTLELAHGVGAGAVLATTGPAGTLTTWEQALSAFAAAYEPLAARAGALGVRVCVENTNVLRQDAGFVTTLADLARLAAESDAWICADMFWSWRERDLAGSLRACGPRLGLVQLADAVPTSVSMPDRVVPGDGVVPLGWVIGQFAAAGYQGYFDVELLGPRITAEGARQAMTRGVRHVSALLQASYPVTVQRRGTAMNQAITSDATPGGESSAGHGDAAAVLASHVATGTVPEASRRVAARLALDTIGAAIAAHDAAGLPGIRQVIEGWGGRPDATVIGTGARVPAHNAALVNSALARAMELDDVHEQALVHATATTVPVALAVAEQAGGVSGRRFTDAVALGNDIACRLALAVDMRLGGADRKPRVMSLTYQTGVLAGSLVAGRVAGLDSGQLLDCLGVGYSQVAGNLQGLFEGTLTVRLQQGIAAQSAVMALEFARAGITGAHDALEGRAGWYPAFFGGRYGYVRDRLTGGLGETFRGDEISIKPYACCKYGHNAITAAIALHDDPGISPGSIAEVVVRVGQDTWDIICDPVSVKASLEQLAGPDGLALAQFSLPFMVATALLRGRLSAAELDAGWRADPALASLLPAVTIVVDEADLTPDMIPEPGRVEVVLADGRRRTAEATRTPGHPEHPLDDAALHAKFRSCSRRLGSRGTEALLEALTHLDEVEDMRQVARLTVPE